MGSGARDWELPRGSRHGWASAFPGVGSAYPQAAAPCPPVTGVQGGAGASGCTEFGGGDPSSLVGGEEVGTRQSSSPGIQVNSLEVEGGADRAARLSEWAAKGLSVVFPLPAKAPLCSLGKFAFQAEPALGAQ